MKRVSDVDWLMVGRRRGGKGRGEKGRVLGGEGGGGGA